MLNLKQVNSYMAGNFFFINVLGIVNLMRGFLDLSKWEQPDRLKMNCWWFLKFQISILDNALAIVVQKSTMISVLRLVKKSYDGFKISYKKVLLSDD